MTFLNLDMDVVLNAVARVESAEVTFRVGGGRAERLLALLLLTLDELDQNEVELDEWVRHLLRASAVRRGRLTE